MKFAHAGLLTIACAIAATAASAQGPPPFELPDDASRSTQVVRMQLGLRDPDGVAPSATVLEARSPFQATLNRTQENRPAATGILSMFPLGQIVSLLPVAGGSVIQTQPSESGSRSVFVFESPNVTGGFFAPYVQIGDAYDFEIDCSPFGCAQWLEGPIQSRAESSFHHGNGTLEVDASVVTPDYGVTDDTQGIYHALRSTAFARLGDWIYVTGAGATATVTVAATLPLALDEPDDDADDASGLSSWITQGSGDLRSLGCFDPVEPNVIQYTRFRFDIELTRWAFEEVCEEGEGSEPICNDEWVDTPLGTHTVSREREMHTTGCESALALVSSDTGALPGSTQLELEIPTNQWVQLYVTTSTDADCEGAMACNLDAQTTGTIDVSVTSPNGTLVSWQGVAGLVRVPEPGAAVGLLAALGSLTGVARRRSRFSS